MYGDTDLYFEGKHQSHLGYAHYYPKAIRPLPLQIGIM